MFVANIKSALAVALVVGLTFGGIGAGIGLPTNAAAVAQQPAGQPGGPRGAGAGAPPGDKAAKDAPEAPRQDAQGDALPLGATPGFGSLRFNPFRFFDFRFPLDGKAPLPGSGPEQKAKTKEIDWRIRAIDDQIAELQELQKQTEKKAAAIKNTIGELRAQRERFLKKPDALKRAELKQAESTLEAAAARAAAAQEEVAKAVARLEEARVNNEQAQATYRLFKAAALGISREKSKDDKLPERKKTEGNKGPAAEAGVPTAAEPPYQSEK